MHKYAKQQKEQKLPANYLKRCCFWLISPKSCNVWIQHFDDLSALGRNTLEKGCL